MTDFITSQISADGQNADLVEDIGGSLLQGMSNSLSTSAKKAITYKDKTPEEPKDEDYVDTVKEQVATFKVRLLQPSHPNKILCKLTNSSSVLKR